MNTRVVFLVVVMAQFSVTSSTAWSDDDCEDVGKLGVMFGQIDQQCPKYELTAAGKKTMLGLAAKASQLGGEKCAEKGKIAMLRQLGTLFPQLDKAAATGNQSKFNAALCDAIARYLEMSAPDGMKTVRTR